MEDSKKEKYIITIPSPVSLKGIGNILFKWIIVCAEYIIIV